MPDVTRGALFDAFSVKFWMEFIWKPPVVRSAIRCWFVCFSTQPLLDNNFLLYGHQLLYLVSMWKQLWLLKFPQMSRRLEYRSNIKSQQREWRDLTELFKLWFIAQLSVRFPQKSKRNLTNRQAQSGIWTTMDQSAVQSKQQFTC